MSFKDNLRDEMEFQDIKQKELSEKTGISVNTIRNYINGHNALPSAEVAVKIAGALGVSVEYLVSGKKSGAQKISSKVVHIENSLLQFSESDLDAVSKIVESIAEKYKNNSACTDEAQ